MSQPTQSSYAVFVRDAILHVVFSGVQDFATTESAIAEGMKMVEERGVRRVLFDFAGANTESYFTETVRHAERCERLGLTRDLWLAFYSPHHPDIVEFMATVASNRGYDARAFVREDEALQWLGTRPD